MRAINKEINKVFFISILRYINEGNTLIVSRVINKVIKYFYIDFMLYKRRQYISD
jgi:hypothetical protein